MSINRKVLLAALALAPSTGLAQVPDSVNKADVVHAYLEAFNAQDTSAMVALVAEDVQWVSVGDGTISIELEGKAAMAAAMSQYFGSCPTCRSEIHSLISSSERVSLVEVAGWVSKDGPMSQSSMAVYEFSGSLIQRVYYFPAEPDPAAPTQSASK